MRKGFAARTRAAGTRLVLSESSYTGRMRRRSGARGGGRAEHPAPTRWEGRAEHPAASRAAWGEGRGAGIPLPPRRRHVTNQRSSSPAGMAFCSSSAADHAGPGMERHSSATRPRSFRTLGVYITVVCIVGSGEPRLHAVEGLGADRPHEGLCVYYGGEYIWLRRAPAAHSGQHGCSQPREGLFRTGRTTVIGCAPLAAAPSGAGQPSRRDGQGPA